jgi:hypothetical protein
MPPSIALISALESMLMVEEEDPPPPPPPVAEKPKKSYGALESMAKGSRDFTSSSRKLKNEGTGLPSPAMSGKDAAGTGCGGVRRLGVLSREPLDCDWGEVDWRAKSSVWKISLRSWEEYSVNGGANSDEVIGLSTSMIVVVVRVKDLLVQAYTAADLSLGVAPHTPRKSSAGRKDHTSSTFVPQRSIATYTDMHTPPLTRYLPTHNS